MLLHDSYMSYNEVITAPGQENTLIYYDEKNETAVSQHRVHLMWQGQVTIVSAVHTRSILCSIYSTHTVIFAPLPVTHPPSPRPALVLVSPPSRIHESTTIFSAFRYRLCFERKYAVALEQFKVDGSGFKQDFSLEVSGTVGVSFFNMEVVRWEPVVEPWKPLLKASLRQDFKGRMAVRVEVSCRQVGDEMGKL